VEDPEIIFIGAGINSLGAALILAREGWCPLVLDRNFVPGGAIRTLELTLPGFKHDIGPMNLSLLAGSPFYAEHRDALAANGLELVRADHPFGSFAADGKFLGITTDQSANLDVIARFSKSDAAAWQRWRDDYDRCAPILFRIFGGPAESTLPMDLAVGSAPDMPRETAVLVRGILVDTLRANLGRRFETDVVKALLAAWAMHLDYAPDIAGGCWFPFLEANGDERHGIALARGGSGRLIQALVRLIESHGGRVLTSKSVDRILVEDDCATGVRLADGSEVRSLRGVVACVTPPALVKLAGPYLPEDFAEAARAFRFGPGTLVIHLALSELPAWTDESARRSFYIHLGPSLDALAAAYREGTAGQLPREPFCVVGQPTVYDPSRAPDGQHVLWIMVRAVPAVITGDAANEIAGRQWTPDVTHRFTDRVLDLVERHAPGFRTSILATAVHTPLDLEALDPNLVGGDLNAGSLHPSQFYGNRPLPGYADHRTPIPRLYLCGASTWPGGGASPGSGTLLARSLLGSTA
jgi:phytoene dehydrogenase-like protein